MVHEGRIRASILLRSPRWLLAVFALSGFAGIIYEALWSHYLKLFLGHAAYAQAAVLILFMAGLSGGAMIATRAARARTDPLCAYVAIEVAIGVLALAFHPIYLGTIQWVQAAWLPVLSTSTSITLVKFGVSAALILPQALLLGATFPLMTTGVLRRMPDHVGAEIARLYFVNSLGAAVGVLAATFVLKPMLGLPGTLRFAGVLNFAIATAIACGWRFASSTTRPVSSSVLSPRPSSTLLIVAGLTGASSLIYEIVWIRLLNMVLGSTSHSFEVMLFTFILGLALGGRWIRRSIDTLRSPLGTLAMIQLAMAVLALTSLAFYDFSFDVLALSLTALAHSSTGYALFLLVGVLLAMMIMLPTTICAGMTLPLITSQLYTTQSERAVGRVYAANTGGAIVAVALTQFVLIPAVGLRQSLIIGAVIDLSLGAWLLKIAARAESIRSAWVSALAACLFACVAIGTFQFDPRKLASGVFRTGTSRLTEQMQIDSIRDGKTATVAVFTRDHSHRVIATNGKPDASMELDLQRPATIDEATQVLSGVLPLAAKPDAAAVAVIGIGSGMTTHALLQGPRIERVDTIEIESAMVDGARLFRPFVAATFDDPRSNIVIDDARTYFAAHARRYDIIVSEPSNPWVSGVAGLFTQEFYHQIKHHLAPTGLFAQWMQLYEISPRLVATVFGALAAEFESVRMYEMGDGNILLMARRHPAKEDFDEVIKNTALLPLLKRIGIVTAADLAARYVGDKRLLAPLFASFGMPKNSDFRPILDEQAPVARFIRASAAEITDLTRAPWPLRELLTGETFITDGISESSAARYRTNRLLRDAVAIAAYFSAAAPTSVSALTAGLSNRLQRDLAFLTRSPTRCEYPNEFSAWRDAIVNVASIALPVLAPDLGLRMITRAAGTACAKRDEGRIWLQFFQAIAQRDAAQLRVAAVKLLDSDPALNTTYPNLLVGALLLQRASSGQGPALAELLTHLNPDARTAADMLTRTVLAHAGWHE